MVSAQRLNRHGGMKACPVYSGFSVCGCRRRHNRLEDVVGLNVLVRVEEAHADVLLLVVAGVLVALQLQMSASWSFFWSTTYRACKVETAALGSIKSKVGDGFDAVPDAQCLHMSNLQVWHFSHVRMC